MCVLAVGQQVVAVQRLAEPARPRAKAGLGPGGMCSRVRAVLVRQPSLFVPQVLMRAHACMLVQARQGWPDGHAPPLSPAALHVLKEAHVARVGQQQVREAVHAVRPAVARRHLELRARIRA